MFSHARKDFNDRFVVTSMHSARKGISAQPAAPKTTAPAPTPCPPAKKSGPTPRAKKTPQSRPAVQEPVARVQSPFAGRLRLKPLVLVERIFGPLSAHAPPKSKSTADATAGKGVTAAAKPKTGILKKNRVETKAAPAPPVKPAVRVTPAPAARHNTRLAGKIVVGGGQGIGRPQTSSPLPRVPTKPAAGVASKPAAKKSPVKTKIPSPRRMKIQPPKTHLAPVAQMGGNMDEVSALPSPPPSPPPAMPGRAAASIEARIAEAEMEEVKNRVNNTLASPVREVALESVAEEDNEAMETDENAANLEEDVINRVAESETIATGETQILHIVEQVETVPVEEIDQPHEEPTITEDLATEEETCELLSMEVHTVEDQCDGDEDNLNEEEINASSEEPEKTVEAAEQHTSSPIVGDLLQDAIETTMEVSPTSPTYPPRTLQELDTTEEESLVTGLKTLINKRIAGISGAHDALTPLRRKARPSLSSATFDSPGLSECASPSAPSTPQPCTPPAWNRTEGFVGETVATAFGPRRVRKLGVPAFTEDTPPPSRDARIRAEIESLRAQRKVAGPRVVSPGGDGLSLRALSIIDNVRKGREDDA